uniref:Uncharacterized protein n=1 Tax=Oryza glumipatula TaxID=40148 RepID=A0A0E0AHC8_9ORYZ
MGNSYSNVGSPVAAGYVQAPELLLYLCFFLVVLLVFLGFSWYMSYESAADRFTDQAWLLLMASPLALLLTPRTRRHSSRRCSSRRWAHPGAARRRVHHPGVPPDVTPENSTNKNQNSKNMGLQKLFK